MPFMKQSASWEHACDGLKDPSLPGVQLEALKCRTNQLAAHSLTGHPGFAPVHHPGRVEEGMISSSRAWIPADPVLSKARVFLGSSDLAKAAA
jgi:hypothetical protein